MSTEASAVGKKLRMLRVVSRCSSVDDFVTVFRRFSDGESLFIVTKKPKSVGTKQPISITLSDGVPVLSGIGEVVEAQVDGGGPAGRSGMRLKFVSLDAQGRAVLKRLGEDVKKPPRRSAVPKPMSPRATIAVAAPPPPPPPKLPRLPTLPAKPSAPVGTPEFVASPPTPPVLNPGVPGLGAASRHAARELDDDEKTNVSDEFAMMQRATGSTVIVPANPLSELNDDALVGFVECALYEESGFVEMPGTLDQEQTQARAPSRAGADPGLPSWWPKTDEAPPPPRNGESTSTDALGTPVPVMAPIPMREEISNGVPRPVVMGGEHVRPPPPPSAPPIMPELGQQPPPRAERPAVVHPLPAQPPSYGAAQTGADPFDMSLVAGQLQSWRRLVVVAVVAALLSFGIGFAIWGDDGEDTQGAASGPATVDTPGVVLDEQPDKQPEPEPDKQPEPGPGKQPEPEPDKQPEPEPAAWAGDGCTLEVTSKPSGVPVLIGGENLGTTPFKQAMGCGAVAVTLAHPRYNGVTKNVTLAPGTPSTINARLQRPVHQMTITSAPSGATVKIGSRTLGKTPVTAEVTGYEKAKIKISKPGYKTWSKQVYARYKKQRVFGKLVSSSKSRKRSRSRKRKRTRKTKSR